MLFCGDIVRWNANSFVRGIIVSSKVVGKIGHATGIIHRRKTICKNCDQLQPTICVVLTYRTSGDTLGIVEGLRRLDNNWVVGVSGEAERADGGEGGEARGLEGDDVDSVRGGLQVDEVEGPGERQGGRALAVDMGRGHHVVVSGTRARGMHHHGTRGHLKGVWVHILGLVNTGRVGNLVTCDSLLPRLRQHQLLPCDRDDIRIMLLYGILDGDSFLLST